MFILRTITADAVEHNTWLGEKFSLTDSRSAPEQFKKLLKSSEVVDSNKEKAYAFVGNEHGNKHIPLFKGNGHFMMSSSGKTFANISSPK